MFGAGLALLDENEENSASVHLCIRKQIFSWYQFTYKTLKENHYCLQQHFKDFESD